VKTSKTHLAVRAYIGLLLTVREQMTLQVVVSSELLAAVRALVLLSTRCWRRLLGHHGKAHATSWGIVGSVGLHRPRVGHGVWLCSIVLTSNMLREVVLRPLIDIHCCRACCDADARQARYALWARVVLIASRRIARNREGVRRSRNRVHSCSRRGRIARSTHDLCATRHERLENLVTWVVARSRRAGRLFCRATTALVLKGSGAGERNGREARSESQARRLGRRLQRASRLG
jgi:hypothetical protein